MLKKPDDVFKLLKFTGFDRSTPYGELLGTIPLAFKTYLNGTGHVIHPACINVIPTTRLKEEMDDPLLRARLCLDAFTGMKTLPLAGQKFKVRTYVPTAAYRPSGMHR